MVLWSLSWSLKQGWLVVGFHFSLVYIGFKSAAAGVELDYILRPKPYVFLLESMHDPF